MLTEKVLIIGGSYFAGRSMVEFLVKGKKGKIHTFNRGNIPLNIKGVIEFHGDRTSPDSIRKNLPPTSWDVVIDFCGYTPEDIEIMINGISGKIRHYIFISTVSVYDHFAMLPLDETSKTLLKPQSELGDYAEYGINKIRAEECLIKLCRERSIPWTVLRPSILYGRYNYAPRETYFFDLMEKEAAIVIPEHNLALFNFIFVEDLAAIIGLCMETSKSYDQVFNAVSPEFVSYEKFVELLGLISGKSFKTIEKPPQTIMQERIPLPFPMDYHQVYSGAKFQKAFGFKYTPLVKGMQKTYEFYRFIKGKNKKEREAAHGCL
jgi:nucleoside-diphosphate-sugar epimerase